MSCCFNLWSPHWCRSRGHPRIVLSVVVPINVSKPAMTVHRIKHLAILLVVPLRLGGCGFPPLCENRLLKETLSPDGNQKAVLFERNCGATTNYSYQISVLPRNAQLPNESGNAFSSYVQNPSVQWDDNRQILIKAPKTGRYRVEKKVGDVSIRYQPYCQNEVFKESISPDRQWTAIAFFGNCNKPIIQAVQVAILPTNTPLTNQPDTVFVAETNQLTLIWQGNQTLKIDYLDMGNVLAMKHIQGNIRIEFDRRPNSAKPL